MWISVDALANWQKAKKTGEVGHPRKYSDAAIECMLTFKEVYHLRLRGAQELMPSVLNALHLGLKSPNYSTLCRRRKTLPIELPKTQHAGMHLVVDSTGVKVFGEGEWKVRQHGVGKRRTWVKLHIGVNEATVEVFSDQVLATAILDRLLHQSATINIKGDSYKLKEKRRAGLLGRAQPQTDSPDKGAAMP
jgi:hypothetical protein